MLKIDTAINQNANTIATKADTATTYSKTEVDGKLGTKADTATTYSKTEVDGKLGTKADTATTYSKIEVDTRLDQKSDLSLIDVSDRGLKAGTGQPVSDLLQTIVDASAEYGGIYIPAGVYMLDKEIQFPYNTAIEYSIEMSDSAKFIATSPMTAMFLIGAKNSGLGTITERQSVRGGIFDGANLATDCIQFTDNITGYRLDGVRTNNAVHANIELGTPNHDQSVSLDVMLSGIRVGEIKTTQAITDAYGILAHGPDWSIVNAQIHHAKYCIASNGFFNASDIHVFGHYVDGDVYGIMAPKGGIFTNIYIDTCNYGVTDLLIDGSFNTTPTRIMVSNLFVYTYAGWSGLARLMVALGGQALTAIVVSGFRVSEPGGAGTSYQIAAYTTAALGWRIVYTSHDQQVFGVQSPKPFSRGYDMVQCTNIVNDKDYAVYASSVNVPVGVGVCVARILEGTSLGLHLAAANYMDIKLYIQAVTAASAAVKKTIVNNDNGNFDIRLYQGRLGTYNTVDVYVVCKNSAAIPAISASVESLTESNVLLNKRETWPTTQISATPLATVDIGTLS
jgi:hypothetical protein